MNNKEATELVRRLPVTFATIQKYIEKLERENAELQRKLAALKINYAQDKENYQCVFKAGMAIEEKLKQENKALLERLEILSKQNEKQTEEYICVDREHGLWKRATVRKEKP